MNEQETQQLREQLRVAFHTAITRMGMARFRQTSFFGSNERKFDKLAA